MKRFLVLAVAVATVAAFCACSKPVQTMPASSGGGDGSAAATINGVAISMDELNAAAKDRLAKIDTEIYQVKKGVLDDMIEDKLIEDAAKKKGVNTDKFLAEEVDAKIKPPTEEEMKALFDARKGSTTQTFDQLKGQISQYLTQNRKAQARAELIARLKSSSDVKIKIEPPRVKLDIEGAPSVGDKDAKVTLVEFSDYQCPFCKRVRPTIWRLVDEYKGKLRYVFMDFPLSFHKDSRKAHEAAHCAEDQGKYFEYNRKLFENQEKIGIDDLKSYAKQLQLDTKKFDKCLDSGEKSKVLDESIARATKVGVSGTPAYFINGVMLSGAQPYESFKALIDSELSR